MTDAEGSVSNEDGLQDLFTEPENFYKPPPEETFDSYEIANSASKSSDNKPLVVKVKLVGKSPLWGHLLWNAGKVTSRYMWENANTDIVGKRIAELGAGAGLPSLVAALAGASDVVVTDYPDPDLIDNLKYNVKLLEETYPKLVKKNVCSVYGLRWGDDPSEILSAGNTGKKNCEKKFDFIVLSDVIFNHSVHEQLLKSCDDLIEPKNGKVFVVFTPHRAKLFHRDLDFFNLAKEHNYSSEKVIEEKWCPMFEEEEETKELRSMVYGYILRKVNKS